MGTNDGCQLAEIETRTLRQYTAKDDLCSLIILVIMVEFVRVLPVLVLHVIV